MAGEHAKQKPPSPAPPAAASTSPLRSLAPPENNYFTEVSSDSEAGSYLRLIDFVYHSTLGLRVRKKKRSSPPPLAAVRFALAERRIRICQPLNGSASRP